MWWDVKFGCTFEVLDHMPRESSATIILKHFQPDATLGRGRSYTEAAGHWTSSGCMQGSIACGSAAVVCIGLILWTGPVWLKTCPRNKSMPGSSAMVWGLWSQILRCSKACLVSELSQVKWELGICISSGSPNVFENPVSLFIHTGLRTLIPVLNFLVLLASEGSWLNPALAEGAVESRMGFTG